MGIYLPNMEMPTNCSECKLRMAVGCCGNLPHNTRMPNCPLIPVPPHGRLIDADALEKEHMKRAYENFRSYQFHVSATAWINEAPTIIPAEEGAKKDGGKDDGT